MQAILGPLAQISADWFIIAAALVILSIDAIRSGAGRATALAIALPLATVFQEALCHAVITADLASKINTPVAHSLTLVALFVLTYVLVRRLVASYDDLHPLLGVLAALAATITILVFWVGIPAFATVWKFNPFILFVFGETYRFWWLLASFLALAYVRG